MWIPSFSSLFFVLIFGKLLWTCLILSFKLKLTQRVRDCGGRHRRRRHPARALSLIRNHDAASQLSLRTAAVYVQKQRCSQRLITSTASLQLPALSPPCTPMSSGSFWSDVCAHARGKPLQTLLISAYASCSVTVRQLCCCCWQPVAPSLQLWIARLPFFFLSCDALLGRLLRIAQAPWRAGTCFACGGEWTRRGGSACGGCTVGSLH